MKCLILILACVYPDGGGVAARSAASYAECHIVPRHEVELVEAAEGQNLDDTHTHLSM